MTGSALMNAHMVEVTVAGYYDLTRQRPGLV